MYMYIAMWRWNTVEHISVLPHMHEAYQPNKPSLKYNKYKNHFMKMKNQVGMVVQKYRNRSSSVS